MRCKPRIAASPQIVILPEPAERHAFQTEARRNMHTLLERFERNLQEEAR